MSIAKQFACLPILALILFSCSKKMVPEQPRLENNLVLDSLPVSEIDIPIRVNLKPLYKLAEQQVQQTYTSPGYPTDYVVDNCETRYMYRFRRGPLQFAASGRQLSMSFTGNYQLAGGQRICSGVGSERTPVTPWSPTCSCGLWEPERRVNVALTASFTLSPNYRLKASLERTDPVPLDRCKICVFNYDITSTVMDRIRQQIDDARLLIIDSLAKVDYRPRFQQLWDELTRIQPLGGYGFLAINPMAIRLSEISSSRDTMIFNIGITAQPVITQVRPREVRTVVPELAMARPVNRFAIFTDTYLNYDSLSRIAKNQVAGKRIDLEKYGKHVIIEDLNLYGWNNKKLVCKVRFSGSATGEFYLTGKPTYDSLKMQLRVDDLDYDIRSKDLMLRSAEFLFSNKILRELRNYAVFDLKPHVSMILDMANRYLNQELRKGIMLNGRLDNVKIEGIYPFQEKLLVRFSSRGNLAILVNELNL
jgi:hypothetical protein